MKVEFENVDSKKKALSHSGRLRSWTVLGYKVMIRTSQTHEMRTQVENWRTFLKGNNLVNDYSVNKNGRVLPRPGSVAASNILASNQNSQNGYGQRSQGNSMFRSQAPSAQSNSVFGPPPGYNGPTPRYANPSSYASVTSNTRMGAPSVNQANPFMYGQS